MEKNMNAFILSSFCHGFKSKIKHSHTLLNNGDTFWEVSLGDSDPVQTRWGHEEQNKTRLNQAQRKRCNREMRFVATHEAWGERDGPMRSEQADEATWITAGRNEGEPFYLRWTGLGLTWTAQLCISATGNPTNNPPKNSGKNAHASRPPSGKSPSWTNPEAKNAGLILLKNVLFTIKTPNLFFFSLERWVVPGSVSRIVIRLRPLNKTLSFNSIDTSCFIYTWSTGCCQRNMATVLQQTFFTKSKDYTLKQRQIA